MVRQEEYDFLHESLQNSQSQLEDLKDVIVKLQSVIQEKNVVIEHLNSQSKPMEVEKSESDIQNETYQNLRKRELEKFRQREDSFVDLELVKLKEVAHLAPQVEFCFQVFEEKAFKYLFDGNKHVSIEIAEQFFKEKLKIEDLDAFLLARYVIEPREQSTVVLQKDRTAYRREIISRLKSIAYKKITEKDFHALEKEVRSEENEH